VSAQPHWQPSSAPPYSVDRVEIEWMDHCINDPVMAVYFCGTIPYDYDCYDEVDGHYVCVKDDGRVSHIYKQNPAIADDGFCGRTFTAKMRDGSVRTWRGGWDTTLPKDSPLTPYVSIVWVETDNRYSRRCGRLTIPRARELLTRFCPGIELYQRNIGYWTVKRIGGPPKNL